MSGALYYRLPGARKGAPRAFGSGGTGQREGVGLSLACELVMRQVFHSPVASPD